MATTYLSPLGNEQQNDANGAPLSGGKIFTYQAGTTTPIATYMDNSGAVGQSNPIVLNTSGLPNNPIWLPAGQAVKMVFTDANLVVLRTVDNIVGINDPSGISIDQWVIYTAAPTFISATSFSVAGDQRNTFQIGRRVRSTNSGGTVYSTITNAVFGAVTTVTVVNDSGVLDSGMSVVSYGLLSYTNASVPGRASLATSGYTISTNGKIEQWGSGTTSAGVLAVVFPIPFPSAVYTVVVSQMSNGAAANATIDTTLLTTSGFTASTFTASTGAATNRNFGWYAVGK